MNLPSREGRQRPVGAEIGTQQDSAERDPLGTQNLLKEVRLHVQHGGGLTRQRQYGGQAPESLGLGRDREVAGRSPRRRSQLGQVRRQPLLQLTRAAGGHHGRPRRAATDVDEEAGTIGL